MIDFATIRFVKLLDELALQTARGIKPFSEAAQDTWRNFLFYDAETSADIVFPSCVVEPTDGMRIFPIVQDACVDELHKDIIGYYEDGNNNKDYVMVVVVPEDEDPFVAIGISDGASPNEEAIFIENGQWYFA